MERFRYDPGCGGIGARNFGEFAASTALTKQVESMMLKVGCSPVSGLTGSPSYLTTPYIHLRLAECTTRADLFIPSDGSRPVFGSCRHHRPDDPCGLVGQSDRHDTRRLLLEQLCRPVSAGATPHFLLPDDEVGEKGLCGHSRSDAPDRHRRERCLDASLWRRSSR